MALLPKSKDEIWNKIQGGLVSFSFALLLIIVNMEIKLRDDVQNLKKDREWEGIQIHDLQNGQNDLRLNVFDLNGRLRTVEAVMQENALPSKTK